MLFLFAFICFFLLFGLYCSAFLFQTNTLLLVTSSSFFLLQFVSFVLCCVAFCIFRVHNYFYLCSDALMLSRNTRDSKKKAHKKIKPPTIVVCGCVSKNENTQHVYPWGGEKMGIRRAHVRERQTVCCQTWKGSGRSCGGTTGGGEGGGTCGGGCGEGAARCLSANMRYMCASAKAEYAEIEAAKRGGVWKDAAGLFLIK